MAIKHLALVLVLVAFPSAALAWCSQPLTPYPPSEPYEPSKPFCMSANNCTDWDIRNYRRELEDYAEGWKRYVRQAQADTDQYINDVVSYAKCKISEM